MKINFQNLLFTSLPHILAWYPSCVFCISKLQFPFFMFLTQKLWSCLNLFLSPSNNQFISKCWLYFQTISRITTYLTTSKEIQNVIICFQEYTINYLLTNFPAFTLFRTPLPLFYFQHHRQSDLLILSVILCHSSIAHNDFLSPWEWNKSPH